MDPLNHELVPDSTYSISEDLGVGRYLPDSTRTALEAVYLAKPELFGMDESELLETLLRDHKYKPTPTENALRIKFWMEYEYTVSHSVPRLDMGRVCSGICTQLFFAKKVMKSPVIAAWVFCRPMDYTMKVKETLDLGLRRLREILEMVPGPRDTRLMDIQAKITKMMDERDQGGIIQRIEQKTSNVHLVSTHRTINEVIDENSMEALDRRLNQLKKESGILTGPPEKSRANIKRVENTPGMSSEHLVFENGVVVHQDDIDYRVDTSEPPPKKVPTPLPPDVDYDEELA